MGEAVAVTRNWILREPIGSQNRPHTSLGFHPGYSLKNISAEESFPPGSLEASDPLWRSSTKYIDPGYGYEKQWRSSRAQVSGGGDSNLGGDATPLIPEKWKSSIRYIDCGSGAYSEMWKSSIKPIKPSCSDTQQWRPAVRIFKLPRCSTESKITGGRRHVPICAHPEPLWHSSRGPGKPPPPMWVPPFRNLKATVTKMHGFRKRVSDYCTRHPQLQLFSTEAGVAGMRSNTNNSMMPNVQQIRAKVAAYFKEHPPLHLFSTAFGGPQPGEKELPSGSIYQAIRRYIPAGHKDHFETPGCITKRNAMQPARPCKTWSAEGPQHHTAIQRNVIAGKLDLLDEIRPRKIALGPSLLAPAANYNKDVIDHRFGIQQETIQEPEIPSYSSQLIAETHAYTHKGYRQNFVHDHSTNPCLNDPVYDMKTDS